VSNKLDPLAGDVAGPRSPSAVGTPAAGGGRAREAVNAPAESDSVKLTGEAVSLQRIERELRSNDSFDAAKVEAARAAITAGSYKVDAQVVATRVVELERMLGRG
jgi:negative regulator of flagellin synthesis FlgM